MSELLTIDEVAERLRLGRRTVERYIARGDIRSAKAGRRRLVSIDELDRFVKAAERRGRVA